VRKGSAEARDAGVVDSLRRAELADYIIFADIDVANLPGVELITEHAHGDDGDVGSLLIDGEQRDGREDDDDDPKEWPFDGRSARRRHGRSEIRRWRQLLLGHGGIVPSGRTNHARAWRLRYARRGCQ